MPGSLFVLLAAAIVIATVVTTATTTVTGVVTAAATKNKDKDNNPGAVISTKPVTHTTDLLFCEGRFMFSAKFSRPLKFAS